MALAPFRGPIKWASRALRGGIEPTDVESSRLALGAENSLFHTPGWLRVSHPYRVQN